MTRTTVTITTEINLDIKTGANWFAGLDDEQQAQFFIEVAEVAKLWNGGLGQSYQWWLVGRHLKNCACSTYEARHLIKSIAEGVDDAQSPTVIEFPPSHIDQQIGGGGL